MWATQWPPVSLATTAALLEREGHRLKVVDCPAVGMGRAQLKGEILSFRPDLAFWTTGTPTLSHDLALSRLVKECAPDCVTGVFGTHVTVLPHVALGHASIDIVIRGEPEGAILDLSKGGRNDWGAIRGISLRNGHAGDILHTPDRELLAPDAIPAPAWRHLDLSPYRLPLRGTPFLIVAPVRGCPYPCSFCTAPIYYGRRLRRRDVGKVVDEMGENQRRFGVRDFFVWADTFTADRGYVVAFCREILGRGLRVSWTCNSRVDTADRQTLSLMKAAGLWMISFGLESGNPHVLERTRKGITVEQSRRAVWMAHDLGIRTSGHFILGLPGETEASMRETLALALELPLDIAQFYAAAPFPGTRLYDLALREGWIRRDGVWAQDHAGMDLPGLPGHRVDAFRRYAYRRFYGRPRGLRNILSMTRPTAMAHMLKDLGGFVKWAWKGRKAGRFW